MFFKKKPITEPKLIDVVTKKMDTGFVFWNISDDLGHSAESIMSSNPKVIMAYAYARRVAAAALYLQGLMNKEAYGHALAFFKGVQQKIGGSVEFQEAAADYSTEFMQSYQFLITRMFERKVIQIANEYEISGDRLSDADLFSQVTETIFSQQPKANERSRPDQILLELQALHDKPSVKAYEVWVRPRDDNWSYEYLLSEEEMSKANGLIEELHGHFSGTLSVSTFPYKPKN